MRSISATGAVALTLTSMLALVAAALLVLAISAP